MKTNMVCEAEAKEKYMLSQILEFGKEFFSDPKNREECEKWKKERLQNAKTDIRDRSD